MVNFEFRKSNFNSHNDVIYDQSKEQYFSLKLVHLI